MAEPKIRHSLYENHYELENKLKVYLIEERSLISV